jgi:uncharacterized membrane protein YdbT with pleckstrin-like domain
MYQDTSVAAFSNNVYQNLGPKTFWFFVSERTKASMIFFVIALILAVVRVQNFVPPEMTGLLRAVSWGVFIIAIIAFLVAFISAKLAHKSFGFLLSEDALKIRRGVMLQEEKAIPYRQIQNIEIERTLSQRMIGLSRVVISTASHDDPNTKHENESHNVLPAMDADIAVKFQTELLRRANIQRVIEVKNE